MYALQRRAPLGYLLVTCIFLRRPDLRHRVILSCIGSYTLPQVGHVLMEQPRETSLLSTPPARASAALLQPLHVNPCTCSCPNGGCFYGFLESPFTTANRPGYIMAGAHKIHTAFKALLKAIMPSV
jgi:hypothetical protein